MKSEKPTLATNVFYTLGFLLLYVHVILNIMWLAQKGEFYKAQSELSITPFGSEGMSIVTAFEEIILVGGFFVLTLLGVIIEQTRARWLKKNAESGWRYRNRMKMYLALIAIITVTWTTFQGYQKLKEFDWVWLGGSAVIFIYCIILLILPRPKASIKR